MPFVLARSSPFSYRCRACSRCCRGKTIPVNPYEIARLAEALGTTTTEVLERFTAHAGATLAVREDATCVFLADGGCSVHAARPLVCRLYPLGRRVDGDGTERFATLEPHPQSEGVWGTDGTVDDYLRAQDVARHVAAAAAYAGVLRMMVATLARAPLPPDVRDEATQRMSRPPVAADESWLDLDAVVARRCAERNEPVPADVDARARLHVQALEEMLDALGC